MPSRVLEVQIIGDAAQLERALGRAAGAAKGFGASMSSVGKKIESAGSTMTKYVTLPVVAAGVASVVMATKFQSAMELIHTQAGASQASIKGLSDAVLKLAPAVGTGPDQLAVGLFHLESQGLRGARAMDALRIAAEGAKVGQANLEDVTNALGAVMVSRIKGVNNLSQAMGQLNATVGAGDMHMQDLADALGTGLPAKAQLAGVSLRDVGAALAVLGDNNIRGAAAGTLLNSTFRIMAAGSKAADKALATINLSTLQLGNDLRSPGGLVSAMEDLKQHIKDSGLSATETEQLLAHAFGGRQSGGVAILLGQLERLKMKIEEVGAGGNKFGSDWAATTQTAAFKFDQLKASLQAAGISLGNVLLPAVVKAAKFFTELVLKFEALPKSTKELIVKIAAVAAVIGPTLIVVGKLTQAFAALIPVISAVASPIGLLVTGLLVLGGAMLAAEFAPTQFEAALEKMGVSASAAKDTIKGLQIAFTVMKDVVLAAISPFRAAITEMVDSIKAGVQLVDALIHGRWSQAWSAAKALALAPLNAFKSTFGSIMSDIAGAVVGYGSKILGGLWNGMKAGWQHITGWLTHLGSYMVQLIGDAGTILEHVGESIIGGLWGGMKSMWHHASGWLSSLGGAISSLKGPPAYDAVMLRPHGRLIIGGLIDGMKSKMADLKNTLGQITAAISNISLNPAQFARAWSKLTAAAVQSIRGGTPAVAAAMRNLENAALTAFDTATVAGTNRIKARTDAQVAAIKSRLNADLATIAAAYNTQIATIEAPVTALQKKIQAQQQAHDLAAAQANISTAEQQLAADQASGTATPQQLQQDQQAIDDANYQLQQLQEQIQLTQEQAAAQKQIAAAKKEQAKADKLAKDEAAKDTKNVKDHGKAEELRWKETRAAERKGLTAYLADVKSGLDTVAKEWKTHHDQLMKEFNGKFKKDFGNAGTALATAFNDSVQAGMRELDSFLKALGIAIGTYLKPSQVPGHAEGAIVGATPGGVYRVAEAGHPEAVLPLDPSKNTQFWGVLSQAMKIKGYAEGGITNPDAGFNAGRYTGSTSGLSDSDYAMALRTMHGLWPSPRRWSPGEADWGTKMMASLQAQGGSLINFEDAPIQALWALKGTTLPDVWGLPPNSIADATWGQIWMNLPGGNRTLSSWALSGGLSGIAGARYAAAAGLPHFGTGGVMPHDGLAYLHKNETVLRPDQTSSVGGGTAQIVIQNLHVNGDLSDPTQRRQTARLLLDEIHSELRRKSQRVGTLGLR